jgi:tRNA dimethylallyltransferase
MIDQDKPNIIIIAGPTASGKTAVGLELAEKFCAEIISADSVQVYRRMDRGSAKPTIEERGRVPHHMIDIRDPDEYFSAGDYVREGRESIEKILEKGLIPLVVGGTGMYIRLLLGGIVDSSPSDMGLREKLKQEEEDSGPGTLFERLVRVDPESARRIPAGNLFRIVRALEVFELTGRTLSQLQREHAFQDRPYRSLFVSLSPNRPLLYERIENRVDSMIRDGLLDEVSQLCRDGYGMDLKSMQSLGYWHMGMVLSGAADMAEAVRLMKRDTRRYAKRQLTWFRSEPGVLWRDPEDIVGIEVIVSDFLGH